MLLLYNFGPKIRKEVPKGLSLTEFIKKRFSSGILKLSLFLILFYLVIFMIAEVTAISFLLNLISKTPLWITAGITLIICLLYILRGGFKLSIITDKYQFVIIAVLILTSVILILGNLEINSLRLNEGDILVVPNNYAHGYECLSKNCTVLYHLDNYRDKKGENGISFKDKDLNIKWVTKKPIVSKRDRLSNSFAYFKKKIKSL